MIEVLTTLGTSAITVAALTWLARQLMLHVLSKDIEAHKAELSRATEVHRHRLEAESSMEIERFKAELHRANREEELRFQTLHARRADVLAELHGLLHTALESTRRVALQARLYDGAEDPFLAQQVREAGEATSHLWERLLRTQLYLDAELARRLEGLVKGLHSVAMRFRIRVAAKVEPADLHALAAWWEENEPETIRLFDAIQDEFRRVLGARARLSAG